MYWLLGYAESSGKKWSIDNNPLTIINDQVQVTIEALDDTRQMAAYNPRLQDERPAMFGIITMPYVALLRYNPDFATD